MPMSNSEKNFRFEGREEYNETYKKNRATRMVICIAILAALAIILCFLRFKPPLVSSMFMIDFSIISELIAAIAYGPVAGAIICFLRYVVHIAVLPNSFIPDVASFIIDLVYLIFVGVFYKSRLFYNKEKNYDDRYKKEKSFFACSMLASLPSLIFQFFLTEFFTFPMLEKHYEKSGVNYDLIISEYSHTADAIRQYVSEFTAKLIPNINAIWQGILVINLPITFGKYVIATLFVMIIYRYISPFLHYAR